MSIFKVDTGSQVLSSFEYPRQAHNTCHFHLGRFIAQIQKLSNCKDGMLKLFSDCLEFYFSPKIRVSIQLDMRYVYQRARSFHQVVNFKYRRRV
jgi:hypothetical protein